MRARLGVLEDVLGRLRMLMLGVRNESIGNGLYIAGHHEDALIVREAELAMMRRMEGPKRIQHAHRADLALRTIGYWFQRGPPSAARGILWALNFHGDQHFDTLRQPTTSRRPLLI